MYLRITSRCNMMCDHCCYSCTSDGEDMTMETFKNALALDSDTVSLGGGEPTLHPKFWEMLGLSLGSCEYVWLATNGTVTETALALARMAKKQVIGCELSQDEFHDYDMVSWEVREAFESMEHGIRDITRSGQRMPMYAGRAKEYYEPEECEPGCVCSELIVNPNGDVKVCGCDDAPIIGNVNDPSFGISEALENLYGEDYEYSECHHDMIERLEGVTP